jgi:acyl-CoA reductase-like NAD-dependent aldehyde dehydrogenase
MPPSVRTGGRSRYENFIGGKWVAPIQGRYFGDHSPINGTLLAEFARSSAADARRGRVWTNCYHLYPAGSAFGGYRQSGFDRETHKMMLDHYQQTKNLLVSYRPWASSRQPLPRGSS